MVTAYFVSEAWIKDNTPINQNVEISMIAPFIGAAQDVKIQPSIGTALYNRLMTGIVNNNLTGNEITLLQLIRPSLAYWTLATALPFVANQVRNAGVVKVKSENTESSTKAEVDGLVAAAQNMAQFYMERVLRYLCDNGSSFPEYSSSDDMAPNSQSPYTGGFLFPNDGEGDCSSCGPRPWPFN